MAAFLCSWALVLALNGNNVPHGVYLTHTCMEFDFNNASLHEILAYAPDLRRDAYVDATLRMQADDNIVGIFGSAYSSAQSPIIDEALIYGYELVPVPVAGVDAFIFKHGDYPGCDVIKSTMVYLTTQKCPLLYSSKMYVLDGCCSAVEAAFRQCTKKTVHRYQSAAALHAVLQEVYGKTYSASRYEQARASFTQLNTVLHHLEHSSLSGNELGAVGFYSRFIFDLDERIAFLTRVHALLAEEDGEQVKNSAASHSVRVPVRAYCPDGIIQKIQPAAGQHFKIVQPPQRTTGADVACAGCVYPVSEYIAY